MSATESLDFREFAGSCLPPGLGCYELDASGSNITHLPADLKVESRICLDGCRSLLSLPDGFTAGSISLRDCTSLTALPEGLSTWFLDLTNCSEFAHWPARAELHSGSLVLRGCVSLRELPTWTGRLANLNLAGCVGLTEIPEGIEVSGWVDVGGTGITGLPRSLQGASLRWRGVRVNERIAFAPLALTAGEVLAERNAEVRRVMIERMGYQRFSEDAGAKVLHEDFDAGGPRQLLKIELDEDEPLVGLACRCPSTARQYWIRVPPQTQTCHQAAAWIAGFDDPSLYHPNLET